VDQGPLSDQQQMQANAVAEAFLRDTAREQQRKLEMVEGMYATAHNGLVSFLTLLDPDFIDTCVKNGQPIHRLDDRLVQQRVIAAIKKLKERVAVLECGHKSVSEADNAESNRSAMEWEQLQVRMSQCQHEVQELKQANEQLRMQATATAQVAQKLQDEDREKEESGGTVPSPIAQGVPEPNWMVTWRQSKTYVRDSVFLCLVGKTGMSRQPTIKMLAAEKLDLRLDNGSLSKPIERLASPDGPQLLECIDDFEKSGSDAGGALPKFYRLTDRGRQAYWMLTGRNAVECEYDRLLMLHKTPEHTFLNMRAMDILEEIGDYSVKLQNPEIKLPDGSLFIPDIVAQKNGTDEVIYVEVERGTGKDTGFRVQKWTNLCAASSGQIYIICDTKRTVKALTSEINSALAGFTYNSHLTDLEELQMKKRGKDGSIWIYQR
jgi:hypothetical protein